MTTAGLPAREGLIAFRECRVWYGIVGEGESPAGRCRWAPLPPCTNLWRRKDCTDDDVARFTVTA